MNEPLFIHQLRDIAPDYDVILCDIWGVIHNGVQAFAPACTAMSAFRASGGSVVFVTNAPRPSSAVRAQVEQLKVPDDAYDAIVSSGDIALEHVAERGFERVHHIGTPRDLPLFQTMRAVRTSFEDADAIVCTGLMDDRRETAQSYRALLERARERDMPLVCANPDLIVDVGGELLPCAGVIAELYAEMGGPVYWAGKPYATAYERAMEVVARLRGRQPDLERVLAIGDAVRTDIAGAGAYGLDSLFIAQGIHRDELLREGRLDPALLARFLSRHGERPVAAMEGVAW